MIQKREPPLVVAARCAELLDDPESPLRYALQDAEAQIQAAWVLSKPTDAAGREALYAEIQGLRRLMVRLRALGDHARMPAKEMPRAE